MKFLLVLFAIVTGVIGYFSFFRNKPSKKGTIIILNGPSGAGKSSIQREFQKRMMPNLWVKTGIDNLFDFVMPDITVDNMAFWQSKNTIRWVEESKDIEGHKLITLYVGEQGDKVAYAMNSAIAAYAENGCDVIVDYIAYKPEWFEDLKHKISKFKTCYVAVKISIDVLEQREKARGTSPQGHARSHYDYVYGDMKYDIMVNTETQSAQEIAEQLQAWL